MADKRLVTFQDTIGQELAWARAAPYQCTVVWRRWHEGELDHVAGVSGVIAVMPSMT